MNNHIFGSALITHRKPDIDYPCEWEYTVIGADEARLREIIFTACARWCPPLPIRAPAAGDPIAALMPPCGWMMNRSGTPFLPGCKGIPK
jgi:hypothetical protein